ncbi:hypothetical protein ACFFRR_006461 [Megaselia abdita]
MNPLIGLLILFLSGSLIGVDSFNESAPYFHNDFFKEEFLLSASRIPDIPGLSTCDRQLLYLFKNWKKLNVFPMIDSWGKLQSGIMKGNFYAIGNFDECLNLNTKLPIPFGTLEGQYCKGMIPLYDVGEARQAQDLVERVDMNRQTRDDVDGLKIYLKSGVCIPKSCNPKELEKKLPFKLANCKVKGKVPLETIDYFTITLMSIIGILLVLGTAYDYLYKGPSKNPYLMAFSVPSNAEKLFHVSTNKAKNNIDCLNGIRVISMIWVIYGHAIMMNTSAPQINWFDLVRWTRTFFSMFTQNAYISVDSFFFMSGLLLAWIGMKEIEKVKGKLNVPLMYLHRYLRLTPMVAFVMLFVLSLLKFFGNGPRFDECIEGAAFGCAKNWWMNLLYIQNYATFDLCLGQTWYLAIDFQLFLFSPLILYGFWKWGRKFIVVILVLIALSVGCIYGTFYSKGYSAALIMNESKAEERMSTYYRYTHTRYSIWLIGMTFGFLLYESKDKTIRMPWYTQVTGWVITAGIIYGVIAAPFYTLNSNFSQSGTTFEGASFEAFSKIGWGIMMSWVVFACYHGYGGVVNSFLSNPIWQPFARMSFAMYMSHLTVMSVNEGNMHSEGHFSNFDMILKFWSHFGITLLVSIALVLAIESPIIGLEKTLFHKNPKPSTQEVIVHEQPRRSDSVEKTDEENCSKENLA